MALYQVPAATFNKDRIWHSACNGASGLAELVLIPLTATIQDLSPDSPGVRQAN